MKTRHGFVSNSSSSSFSIPTNKITIAQMAMIQNHVTISESLNKLDPDIKSCNLQDEWRIDVSGAKICGYTYMDNFSMRDFLEQIGVPSDTVIWED